MPHSVALRSTELEAIAALCEAVTSQAEAGTAQMVAYGSGKAAVAAKDGPRPSPSPSPPPIGEEEGDDADPMNADTAGSSENLVEEFKKKT